MRKRCFLSPHQIDQPGFCDRPRRWWALPGHRAPTQPPPPPPVVTPIGRPLPVKLVETFESDLPDAATVH